MLQYIKEEFESVCPSGAIPDDTVIDRLYTYLRDARNALAEYVPMSVIEDCESVCYVTYSGEATNNGKICVALRKYMIARAYYEAIPHLDLVLTSTGFGIVSNNNVAPASKERVVSLRNQVSLLYQRYMEDVFLSLRNNQDFVAYFLKSFGISLFWNSSTLSAFGIPERNFNVLVGKIPEIARGENQLKQLISPVQFEAIVRADISGTADIIYCRAADLCRAAVVSSLNNYRDPGARMALLSFLDENIGQFSLYKNSTSFAANHRERYENASEDPCYFF